MAVDPQLVTACRKWWVDKFEFDLLTGLVIDQRKGVMDIRFEHDLLLSKERKYDEP